MLKKKEKKITSTHKLNKWQIHVKNYQKKNPTLKFKDVLIQASKSYIKEPTKKKLIEDLRFIEKELEKCRESDDDQTEKIKILKEELNECINQAMKMSDLVDEYEEEALLVDPEEEFLKTY